MSDGLSVGVPSDPSTMLAGLLARATGQEIAQSRIWRIEMALRPVMRDLGVADLGALATLAVDGRDDAIRTRVIDAMLNHETSFFRDRGVFQAIERVILPNLRAEANEKLLRIWSAGCSTGMEPYSLAMMLKRMGSLWDGWRISIVATDVSPLAIARAQAGRFAQMEVQRGLSVDDLLHWFELSGEDWRIVPELRNMVHFQTDNLLDSRLPSGGFDLILCRNVMLYFPEAARAAAYAGLARQARPGCYLLLGAGETLVGHQSPFVRTADVRGAYRMPAQPLPRRTN